MSGKYSEYDRPSKRAETASEKLRSLYRTGDEDGTKKPDDGSTFNGLLTEREQKEKRGYDV